MDPLTIALIGGLFSGAGGFFGGMQQAQAQGASTEEMQRQFNLSRKDRKLAEAYRNYVIQQRLGMPQTEYIPNDIFNPQPGAGPPQLGGYDRAEFAKRVGAYQPPSDLGDVPSGLETQVRAAYEAWQKLGGRSRSPFGDQAARIKAESDYTKLYDQYRSQGGAWKPGN